jgi:hypothetical protein
VFLNHCICLRYQGLLSTLNKGETVTMNLYYQNEIT